MQFVRQHVLQLVGSPLGVDVHEDGGSASSSKTKLWVVRLITG